MFRLLDRRRRVAAVAALAVVSAALASAAAAGGGKQRVVFNAADQAAARAAVIKRADLGSVPGWKGGPTKPDLSSSSDCSSYHPDESGLVVTGAAQSVYTKRGLQFMSEADVMRTSKMVQVGLEQILAPAAVDCMRELADKGLPAGQKLVSVDRLSLPRLARYTGGFRVLIDVSGKGKTTRVLVDMLFIGRGRTEITLMTWAAEAAKGSVFAAELRLARILVARARV